MVSIETIRNALPPFRNDRVIIKDRQGTADIVNEILKTHELYAADYDRIYQYFDTGNIYETCRGIWEFLKYNLVYNAENDSEQSTKSPSAILHPGEKIDCKHYSLFAGGVLDAIKRNEGDTWKWNYRFVSYYPGESIGHVFVVVNDGSEIWLDPVLTSFDQRKKYSSKLDKAPMALVRISGIGAAANQTGPEVTVNKSVAWSSFLTGVNENMFSLKNLLRENPAVTNGALKNYCTANGFDYNQLMTILNS